MKTKTIKGFYMEYVTVRNVPLEKTASGKYGVTAHVWGEIEKMVATEILTQKVPLRGREVKFLRKAFGLSARALAELMGISHVAILKWEKQPEKRLDMANEIAVRAMLATHMHIDMMLKNAVLKGIEKASKIEVDASKVA